MNQIQQKVLESNKHITLIANGRCQGATEAMILKSLISRRGSSLFIVPHQRDVTHIINQFKDVCNTTKEGYVINRKGHLGIWFEAFGNDVNIVTAAEAAKSFWLKVNVEDVYVDRPELLPKVVDTLLQQRERFNQITFATNPIECGWRNPEIVKGLPDFDNNGNMITSNRSWDYNLIDWKPFKHNTRAEIEEYKPFVEIINIPPQENYLIAGYQPYNEEQSLYLTGDWITGVEIKL